MRVARVARDRIAAHAERIVLLDEAAIDRVRSAPCRHKRRAVDDGLRSALTADGLRVAELVGESSAALEPVGRDGDARGFEIGEELDEHARILAGDRRAGKACPREGGGAACPPC